MTDTWILARAKLKPKPDGSKNSYYGAYLGGFPERARRLVGCSTQEPLLHVCGGMARLYPYAGGFCTKDQTLDLDPATAPDFCQDAMQPFPILSTEDWGGILIDPPYSLDDADKYTVGRAKYPNPNTLVKNGIAALPIGRKVGIIHYLIPMCPKNAKFVAIVGVFCGFNNRIRAFSVYERIS